jgi:nitrogen fixation protein NifU and related proteins
LSAALYHHRIVELARRADEFAPLESHHGSAHVDNPLCGDDVRMDVELDTTLDVGRLVQLGFKVRGCLLCEASAVWLAQSMPGNDAAELAAMFAAAKALLLTGELADVNQWIGLDAFAPVHNVKSRRRCVLLPFEALTQALEAAISAENGSLKIW